ncbi:MAG: VCBS repeat-containing protein, partial [Deltaproteobacteria bacterium]|nr:VCBS repeat-containing protein [Deltaproteobacteria bacterium]
MASVILPVNLITGSTKVWLNDGNGTFTDSGQLIGLSQSLSLSLRDLDNDGDLDVFIANYGANKLYLNTTALPATYDATGSWTNATNNNWVDPG